MTPRPEAEAVQTIMALGPESTVMQTIIAPRSEAIELQAVRTRLTHSLP